MPRFMPARPIVRQVELSEQPGGFPGNRFIASLEAFWAGKRDGARLPTRADFPFESLRPWIGHVSLVDVESDPLRFRWRLIGSEIVARMGRDSTGKWFEELYDAPWLDKYIEAYSTAVARREPAYFRGNLEFVDKEYQYFNSVHLPLAGNGEDVDMLMLALEFEQLLSG